MRSTEQSTDLARVSDLLQAISTEPRLEILQAIGAGEACVCHLEAILGYRQAYISQQLMALREASLLETRRDGKFVHYRLGKPEIMEIVNLAGILAGLNETELTWRAVSAQGQCECPSCAGEESMGRNSK